jgi:chromosome segregation ATPase
MLIEMDWLFEDLTREDDPVPEGKEAQPLEKLRDLEEKIAGAIVKVKALKEENAALGKKNMALQGRISELERMLMEKEEALLGLSSEKTTIKDQLSELLSELEAIEIN